MTLQDGLSSDVSELRLSCWPRRIHSFATCNTLRLPDYASGPVALKERWVNSLSHPAGIILRWVTLFSFRGCYWCRGPYHPLPALVPLPQEIYKDLLYISNQMKTLTVLRQRLVSNTWSAQGGVPTEHLCPVVCGLCVCCKVVSSAAIVWMCLSLFLGA